MCNYSFNATARLSWRPGSFSLLFAAALAAVLLGTGRGWAGDTQSMAADDWAAFAPGTALTGGASMYNPYTADVPETERQTASGEIYDPESWTAAVQIDLRDQFGGVRFGRNYKVAYALVECEGKRTIVRVNDVGPLRPGRIMDFNEKTMRYFDPTLEAGVLPNVTVTPLEGDTWTPGPIASQVVVAQLN